MHTLRKHLWLLLLVMVSFSSYGQQQVTVNLGMLDGLDLIPGNIFNYQVLNNSGKTQSALVKGTLRYRGSRLQMAYTFSTILQPGMNVFSKDKVGNPAWTFSDNALKELFFNYARLPQGTYEYCVELEIQGNESKPAEPVEGCLYNTARDIFLINLVSPENDAKLYEYNPMLNWVVNYPFASELTYRVRVAELKKGQNAENAITRNNPMYQDNNMMGTTVTYPVTAKPLETWQPYVWTVDAYYKGILLGGAEVWKFTIIEDSVLAALPHVSVYVDIRKEKDASVYYAVGELKLKYVLDEKASDILAISLLDKNGKKIDLKEKELKAVLGDNRYEIDLKNQLSLKHMGSYQLVVTNSMQETFNLPLKYINPDFIK
jgi:hypothetical protein